MWLFRHGPPDSASARSMNDPLQHLLQFPAPLNVSSLQHLFQFMNVAFALKDDCHSSAVSVRNASRRCAPLSMLNTPLDSDGLRRTPLESRSPADRAGKV